MGPNGKTHGSQLKVLRLTKTPRKMKNEECENAKKKKTFHTLYQDVSFNIGSQSTISSGSVCIRHLAKVSDLG